MEFISFKSFLKDINVNIDECDLNMIWLEVNEEEGSKFDEQNSDTKLVRQEFFEILLRLAFMLQIEGEEDEEEMSQTRMLSNFVSHIESYSKYYDPNRWKVDRFFD